MRTVLFAPSVLGAAPLFVGAAIDSLEGNFDWLHLDVMDGHFVQNLSFGPSIVKALRERYQGAFIDVHLMVDRLDVLLPAFLKAGASQLTIHAEVEPQLLHSRLCWIRDSGVRAGVAVAPVTPVEQLSLVLPLVDVVMVMSVTPGFGGQTLIESTLEKTRDLVRLRAAEGYNYLTEMDGGIRLENAAQVAMAGCDVLVIGSALFSSPDPAAYLRDSRQHVREALNKF